MPYKVFNKSGHWYGSKSSNLKLENIGDSNNCTKLSIWTKVSKFKSILPLES